MSFIVTDAPLCHMCGQRIVAEPRLMPAFENPDDWLRWDLKRRFIEHENEGGDICGGSGQALGVCRGREASDA